MKEPGRAEIDELSDWTEIIRSKAWKAWVRLEQTHAETLTGKVMTALKNGDYREADRLQAKIEDTHTRVALVKRRISELNKKGE